MSEIRRTGSAGSGSPGPAEPVPGRTGHPPAETSGGSPAGSARPTAAGSDAVAPEARRELDRIRRRWSELPLAQAADAAPRLRALLTDLATRTTPSPAPPPADLGPAVLVDQLAVLVWDAYALNRADGILGRLTTLRRTLP
ncbi:MAG: hypothetical protein ACRCXL_03710 [Dermatophilaceae bacterium]